MYLCDVWFPQVCSRNVECVETLGRTKWCSGPKTSRCYTFNILPGEDMIFPKCENLMPNNTCVYCSVLFKWERFIQMRAARYAPFLSPKKRGSRERMGASWRAFHLNRTPMYLRVQSNLTNVLFKCADHCSVFTDLPTKEVQFVSFSIPCLSACRALGGDW